MIQVINRRKIMSDEKNVSTSGSGGIGISGVLGIVFVVAAILNK